ncbi:hypothetical protein Lser_V15G08905 [Lactuca serriola]
MAVGTRLNPSLDEQTIDLTLYRSVIGSLLYLTASRPDIMFSVCNCARYQSNPREPHLTGVKNIFHYLKGTPSLGLWYPSKTVFFIQAFTDAVLGGCNLDRKSTSGGCQLLDGKLNDKPKWRQDIDSAVTVHDSVVTVHIQRFDMLRFRHHVQWFDKIFLTFAIFQIFASQCINLTIC